VWALFCAPIPEIGMSTMTDTWQADPEPATDNPPAATTRPRLRVTSSAPEQIVRRALAGAGMRRARSERGMTITELMVVLLIVGILMAIAIPLYLVERSGTGKAVAQDTADSALTAATSIYGAAGAYGALDFTGTFAALMQDQYPSLHWYRHTWKGAGSMPADAVSVQRFDNNQSVVLAAEGAEKCWEIARVNQPGSSSGLTRGTWYAWALPTTQYGCAVAPSTPGTSWYPSWRKAEAAHKPGGSLWDGNS